MKTRARIAITIRNTRHLVECKKIGEILWELAAILACSRRCLWPIDPRSIRTIGVFPPFSKTGEHSSRSTYRDRSLLHLLILRVMQAPISFFPKGRNGHCCKSLSLPTSFLLFNLAVRTIEIEQSTGRKEEIEEKADSSLSRRVKAVTFFFRAW